RLVSHQPDLLRRRPDEHDVRPLADLRELGVLREEPVPGMDRVRPRDLRRRDQPRDVQIAVPRQRRTDAHILIRETHVQRLAIRLAVYRDRPDPEFPARADHPERDLAPVRYQDFPEQSDSGPCGSPADPAIPSATRPPTGIGRWAPWLPLPAAGTNPWRTRQDSAPLVTCRSARSGRAPVRTPPGPRC